MTRPSSLVASAMPMKLFGHPHARHLQAPHAVSRRPDPRLLIGEGIRERGKLTGLPDNDRAVAVGGVGLADDADGPVKSSCLPSTHRAP